MIDSKTSRYLNDIGRQVPKELMNSLTVEDEPIGDEQMKERLDYLFRHTDGKTREKLKFLKDNGAFDSEKTYSINPAVEKEIEKFWEAKIGQAIRDKKIPSCKLDQFARKHLG